MKVHHLNCGTLCPAGERWLTGKGALLGRARLVCHCLLVESAAGLVLVETGFGDGDMRAARARLGRLFMRLSSPRLDPDETARAQLERLGFRADDVRHIVLTHAHVDHAGGIADFPNALVHVYAPESRAVITPQSAYERRAYRQPQFAHGPRWMAHELEGDTFLGLRAVRPLSDLGDELALVPMPGHTPGHAAVAVRGDRGWLLHAGDAYFHHRELREHGDPPPLFAAFRRLAEWDSDLRAQNLARLRRLKAEHAQDVHVFCAHDASEFDALAGAPAA